MPGDATVVYILLQCRKDILMPDGSEDDDGHADAAEESDAEESDDCLIS